MKLSLKAYIALAAFVGGFLLAVFEFYTLTRYGTPNPAFAKSLLLQNHFWGILLGLTLCVIGAFNYYWILSPASSFKDLIRTISPFAAISIALSSAALIGIPISRLIGPWDIIQAIILMVSVGLTLLISFIFGTISLFTSYSRFFSIASVVWCVSVTAILYVRFSSPAA